MRKINILAVSALLIAALFSCNNSATKEEDKKIADTSATTANKMIPDPATTPVQPMQVDAMFVDFSLGDASHFMFKDSTGKTWDFGKDEDTTAKFAIELPKAKVNETNQGWGSNKALQGKWFHIFYVYSDEPQYEGGPMAKVAVIKHVEQKH